MRGKGSMMHTVIVHLVLIGVLLVAVMYATGAMSSSRGVKQQVLEKQIALLLDSSVPGMSFRISRINGNGVVQDIEISEGKVFVIVDGLGSLKGYPIFSKYRFNVRKGEDDFVISVS